MWLLHLQARNNVSNTPHSWYIFAAFSNTSLRKLFAFNGLYDDIGAPQLIQIDLSIQQNVTSGVIGHIHRSQGRGLDICGGLLYKFYLLHLPSRYSQSGGNRQTTALQ